MSYLPQSYVISLPEASERRSRTSKHLDELDLPHEYISATDGRAMDVNQNALYAGKRRRLFFGRDLLGAEMGCLLSHRAVWQKIVDDDVDVALVFEDDVVLKDIFPDIVRDLMKHRQEWQLVRFLRSKSGKLERSVHRKICDLSKGYSLYRFRNAYGGAFAYLISQDAAKEMLRASRKNYQPIDLLMGQKWNTGLNNLVVLPCIADIHEESGSYIGDERFLKGVNIKKSERLIYPATRAAYKVYESVMKCLYYYI